MMETPIAPETVLRFLWDGFPSDAYFEVSSDPRRRRYFSFNDAITHSASAKFFGILPRVAKGGKKEHCWPVSQLIWTDIDAFNGTKGVSIDQAKWLIENRLRPRGLQPTYIQKAHGVWFFFRCADPIPTEKAEELNKALARVCSGDQKAWDKGRICRIPGSVHDGDTAHPVPVHPVFLDESIIYSQKALEDALSDLIPKQMGKTQRRAHHSSRPGHPEDRIYWLPFRRPNWASKWDLRNYLNNPALAQSMKGTRSDIEDQIVRVLMGNGFNRAQIHFFFDHELPSKYVEESKKGNGTKWLNRSINRVLDDRQYDWLNEHLAKDPKDPFLLLFADEDLLEIHNDEIKNHSRFNKNIKRDLSSSYLCTEYVLVRQPRRKIDRRRLVNALKNEQPIRQAEFERAQAEILGVDQKTIHRNIAAMIATGLIIKEQDPTSGRHRILRLDPEKSKKLFEKKRFPIYGDQILLGNPREKRS